MNEKLDVKPLPEKLTCPVCEGEIEYVSDFQNPQPIRKGGIMVCGHCASILKVGDSNLIKMTKEEFKALDEQSRHLVGRLSATILARNVSEKVKDNRAN